MSNSEKEPGVSFFDFRAIARYCDPSVHQQFLEANEKLAALDRRGRVIVVGAESQPRDIALSDCKIAREAICSNLLAKLQAGELIAIGYVIGPAGRDLDTPMRQIPGDVLSDRKLIIKRGKKTISGNWLTFGDVRVCMPTDFQECNDGDKNLVSEPANSAPPKGKAGRKARWDWETANREMMRLANSPDGLPHPQAALEKHFAEWFIENYKDSPVESAIRDFVTKRLPSNYR